ncbi:MAG: LysR family transcriptional regulator [Pseudomonadota bacterium]
MDRLTSIEVFVLCVEEGSLAAAGRRCGLSASMAGKHVSALEAQLTVRLLQRSTRSLHLTDAGRAFFARAKRILDDLGEANREASDAGTLVQGPIRIAAPISFGTLHLSAVIIDYLNQHPGVHADVQLDDRYIDLQAAAIDVAVRIGILPDSSLVARRLAPCKMTLCAAPSYCERAGMPAHPDDLARAPLLQFNQAVSVGDWSLTDTTGRTCRVDGQRRLASNNMELLLSAALAGMGVAYGPTFIFGPFIASGALLPLLPAWRATELAIYAVYPSARHVPLKVRNFIDFAANAFGEVPPWDRAAAPDGRALG